MSTSVRPETKKPSKGRNNRRSGNSADGAKVTSKTKGQGRSDSRKDGTATVRSRSASETAKTNRRKAGRSMSAASLKDGKVRRVSNLDRSRSSMLARAKARSPFRDRVGGVAPFVPPRNRLDRTMRMREWSRRGFVQLSPGKQKLRHRILPRTVIGIASMLMAAGIGAAFSGAAFYAYYDDRLAENERTVARFVEGFDQQFSDAAGALDEMRTESVSTIRDELGPLEDYVSDARGVINLPTDAGPSVWLVETKDENGKETYGSAFAIVGHKGGTALVTSYTTVLASTTNPGPGIELVKGNSRIPAELWSWDAERDLALVVVEREIPILTMAGENAQLHAIGGRIFAMSGFGGQGATASPGVLLDHSRVGLQHTAPVGTFFMGGPLLNSSGQVLGVAAGAYSPFGIDPGAVSQAPDVRAICVKILQCSQVEEEFDAALPGEAATSDVIEVQPGPTDQ